MIEGINTIKKEIHENAVAHGWWEEERSFGEICALIHSELSEALEEYRAGRPNFWYTREDGTVSESIDEWHGEKPEGIAVELADAVIRILDYFGRKKVSFIPWSEVSRSVEFFSDESFGDFITGCHSDITYAYTLQGNRITKECVVYLSICIYRIDAWFGFNGLDLARIIAIKHQYNKTRPYKHGGKKI